MALWERTVRNTSFGTWKGERTKLGMLILCTVSKVNSCLCAWMTSNWLEGSRTSIPFNPGCTQREGKSNESIVDEYRKMFKSRISDGAIEKLPGWEKSHANTIAWSYNMEGRAKKCVEAVVQSLTPCLDDHQFKKKDDLVTVGDLSKVCAQIVLQCLYVARIGRPDIPWSVNKLARAVTKMDKSM